jgi:cobalt/nickel transport system ATP-binding protein
MTTPLFELRSVTCRYPAHPGAAPRTVLDGLDFAFAPQMRAGLIGPNGCGKTTLFNVIMGLTRPDHGEMRFKGAPVATAEDLRNLRRGLGLLFQNSDDQLFNPTVLEDVAFGPLNLGLTPRQARERAAETLDLLGLSGFEERITHKLSGGEKKLVALATILAMRPEALLLDEPTNDLDPATRGRLIGILGNLDVALFVISHDLDFLAQTTSGTFSMKNGRIENRTMAVHTHAHVHAHGDMPHVHGNGVHPTGDHAEGVPHEHAHAHAHDGEHAHAPAADSANEPEPR